MNVSSVSFILVMKRRFEFNLSLQQGYGVYKLSHATMSHHSLPIEKPAYHSLFNCDFPAPASTHSNVAGSPAWRLTLISAPRARWTAPPTQTFCWRRWPEEGRRWLIVLHVPTRATGRTRTSAASPWCPLITGSRSAISPTRRPCSRGRRGGCRTRTVAKSSCPTGSGAGVNQRERPDR